MNRFKKAKEGGTSYLIRCIIKPRESDLENKAQLFKQVGGVVQVKLCADFTIPLEEYYKLISHNVYFYIYSMIARMNLKWAKESG